MILSDRLLLLLGAGFLLLALALPNPELLPAVWAWDGAVGVLFLLDLLTLPRARRLLAQQLKQQGIEA